MEPDHTGQNFGRIAGGTVLIPSKESIEALAAESGFGHGMLEKSIHLLSLLDVIFEDDFLKDRLVLKGGTALNLFHFQLPRLSIDIDFNYIGSADLSVMQEEREQVESLILAIAKSLRLTPTKVPADHACRKYTATYHSNFAGRGNVQLDINYLHRVCYFPPEKLDSIKLGIFAAENVQVISLEELAGGKIAALFGRRASRDLFDVFQLSQKISSKDKNLRLAYVLYGAKQPKDWRTVTLDDMNFDTADVRTQLLPVLNTTITAGIKSEDIYAKDLIDTCRKFLKPLFPLTAKEEEFIALLRDQGVIKPELLTYDRELAEKIKLDPALIWRASKSKK